MVDVQMNAAGINEDHEQLQHLLEKVYRERGVDFRGYRETTLVRRLSRRLRARGAQSYAAYAHVLDEDPSEYDRLVNDLTISVSSFFRDDVAFRALEEVALPALSKRRTEGQRQRLLRIWSAGCATGQEPYSIAILLMEMLGQEIASWDITILGTDVDARALGRAQEGQFARGDVENIRPEWLSKYFTPDGDGFRVQPYLRRLVTLAAHNLVSDPPYQNLDLVVCRNVFIYYDPTLQRQILWGFHEALNDRGFLLLGKAEAIVGEARTLFDPVDTRAKLYQKVARTRAAGNVAEGITHHVSPAMAANDARNSQSVVVIGASAGGIDALTQVLSRLPADLPAAVLVVQHLRPERETRLPQHLAHYSLLRVLLAQDGLPLESGVIYVAVPGQHLRVDKSRLVLSREEPVHHVRPSADVLFTSAAQAFGPNTIGVVLSGTGRDGADGCQEIKAKGGMTIAQDEGTSRNFAMPKAAINARAIDYVLPVTQIARQIVAFTRDRNCHVTPHYETIKRGS